MTKMNDEYLDKVAEFAVTGKTRRKSTRPVRSAWIEKLQSQGQR